MQMKKILGILLAFCFLMSVTAAAVSAAPGNSDFNKKDENKGDFNKKDREEKDRKDRDEKKRDDDRFKSGDREDKKIEKEVIAILKKIKTHNGIWKLLLIKNTKESHHDKDVWFTKEWKFVPFEDHDHR